MRRLFDKLEEYFNDFKVSKKLFVIYIFCVILPLVITDGFLLFILQQRDADKQTYIYQNIANAVQYELITTVKSAVEKSSSIYLSEDINNFLEQEYTSPLEYYNKKLSFGNNIYDSFFISNNHNATIYVNNESIINGDHFGRINTIKDTEWYEAWSEIDLDMFLYHYYDKDYNYYGACPRKFTLIRRLDYFKNSAKEKLIKVDMDYSAIVRNMNNSGYEAVVYVCSGGEVIFSNDGHLQFTQDFEPMNMEQNIGYETTINLYGKEFKIYVIEPADGILDWLSRHVAEMVLVLCFSVLFPMLMVVIINRSITNRLKELDEAFDGVKAESLQEIENVRGKDEIGNLMSNYNHMVRRSRELIRTVYQNRLEKQEMDIARQNAELLALQSQINPHFLFNVLESIRMHSMLKGEKETAKMIESLAILERENVNWSTDQILIADEMRFIEAYLQIQRYRFGERLKYSLEVSEGCEDYYIPKLTIVTFVENACVHGMEGKVAGCHIYVRVYDREDMFYIEIEDTGSGMSDEMVAERLQKINTYTIEDLKKEHQVGIINACLRMKMYTGGQVEFEIESEEGIGTFILIKVPKQQLKREREDNNESEGNVG
ncbi:MAG: sensor histidine kinase [Lachnospiraceae bacterium]|nr:sensor histidine kinase [Lachnospiraceae bacterium]